ncbi:uncharacterized membrane protein YidH (DUF202 family) [Streptomyces sp. V3I8]|uniref:DUF202 domain-containing protein n=1 Tax=Streptomyces sp. V3I8 TaxID=3042279 RepID=UPI00277DECEA|nr:DUF202 domain-containing protein [Streptomyces sp. V3I8]MDQ1039723.1 uncharacterized membrane protein YidH (DUF202 family) [Streptomyces sp. V3I8]
MTGPAPAPAPPARNRDPGLQPERTRLAWRRTTLTATVVTVLAGRSALRDGPDVTAFTACALCCGVLLGFLAVAHRRIRALSGDTPPAVFTPRHAAMAALCTIALAVCATALVL